MSAFSAVNGEESMVNIQRPISGIRHTLPGGQRHAFTLIEVMVSVMIISVVIASLLQLFSNNTHLLGGMGKRVDMAMRSTLLLGIGDRGFEGEKTTLDTLAEGFEIDDDLRRRLKTTHLELGYRETMRFGEDMTPQTDRSSAEEEAAAAAPVLEVGSTSLKIGDQQTSLVRIRLQ